MDIDNYSKKGSASTLYKDSPDHLPISRVLRTKRQARASYNKISPIYDFISIGSENKFIDLGLKKLNVQQDEKVLDVGFGTGYAILQLAKAVGKGGKTIGVDISEGMVRQAERKIRKTSLSDRIELLQADASDLPFKLDWFDAVFMSFTLELFDNPEIPVILMECQRILRIGGRIGVVALAKMQDPGLMSILYERAHRYFPNLVDCRPIYLHETLAKAGFQVGKITDKSMWGLPVEVVIARKNIKGSVYSN